MHVVCNTVEEPNLQSRRRRRCPAIKVAGRYDTCLFKGAYVQVVLLRKHPRRIVTITIRRVTLVLLLLSL